MKDDIKLPPCVSCSRAVRYNGDCVLCCVIPDMDITKQFQRPVEAAINGYCDKYRERKPVEAQK